MDTNKEKDQIGSENIFKEPSSPKNVTSKKDKTKYHAFRSDDDESSDNEENEPVNRKLKFKKERQNTSFKVKIKNIKVKKKEKEKDREHNKETKNRDKKRVKKGDTAVKETNVYPLHEPVFGVPFQVAVERSHLPDKIELPRIVRECIIFIEEKGLDTEGIYRVSGVKSKVDQLKALYNEGRPVALDDFDPNTVASLLKLYLRELPSSILTTRLAPIFENCVGLDNPEEQVNRFKQLLNDLPCPNRTLLQWLFTHFAHVMELGADNKMSIQNLSIVFSPTMSISHGVLNIFFENTKDFFHDVDLIKYVPPVNDDDGLPNTLVGLQKLLQENEAVLAELHDKVNQGDSSQDEELWERQRQATQIKRKIKTLKKLEKQRAEEKNSRSNAADKSSLTQTTSNADNKANTSSELGAITLKEQASARLVQPPWTAKIVDNADKNQNQQQQNINKEKKEATVTPGATTTVKGVDTVQIKPLKPPASKQELNLKKPKKKAPVRPTQPRSKPVEVTVEAPSKESSSENVSAVEVDVEYEEMLREEQRLLIENEELLAVTQLIKRKIQMEQREIEVLKEKLQQRLDNKDTESLSSGSSFSSTASLSQEEDETAIMSDEEDLLELEMILNDLEKDNKTLEAQGNDLLQKISDERKICSKLRTEIRVKESLLAARAK